MSNTPARYLRRHSRFDRSTVHVDLIDRLCCRDRGNEAFSFLLTVAELRDERVDRRTALDRLCEIGDVARFARVRASGKQLGRPAASVAVTDLMRTAHLSVRSAADILGVSRSVVHRARMSQKPAESTS